MELDRSFNSANIDRCTSPTSCSARLAHSLSIGPTASKRKEKTLIMSEELEISEVQDSVATFKTLSLSAST